VEITTSKWLQKHIPDWKRKSYLVAISGGVDSVVLCQLFHKLGIKYQLAHCNFQLRGDESDGDEVFITHLANSINTQLHTIKFETDQYASYEKLSTQEAARKLRYNWFETLRTENNLDYIVVGTHKSDEVETLLINQIRGAGLRGLHGILPVKGQVVRPLLSSTREQILEYAQTIGLGWREDSSNSSEKYMRNKIRHQIIPVLKEIRENVETQFSTNAEAIRDYQQVLENEILRLKPTLMSQEKHYWKINKSVLSELKPAYLYLYELILEFGFSYDTCRDVIASLRNQPGALFYGKHATLTNDREYLIVDPTTEKTDTVTLIEESTKEINTPIKLSFELLNIADFTLSKNQNTATLDFDKLDFPLTLRKWKDGDRFQPFGMKGVKKVSDFLIDNKVPRNEKSSVYVLESKEEIVWVVGYRISDRFKVDTNAKRVYLLELIDF